MHETVQGIPAACSDGLCSHLGFLVLWGSCPCLWPLSVPPLVSWGSSGPALPAATLRCLLLSGSPQRGGDTDL